MTWAEWVGDRQVDWRQRKPEPLAGLAPPVAFLGEEEAAAEWNESTRPARTFVRLETYGALQDPRSLYLFGRRGTGKTTYLRMLDYEVRSGRSRQYAVSRVLNSQDIIFAI